LTKFIFSFSILFLKMRGLALWASECILRPTCKFTEMAEIDLGVFRNLAKQVAMLFTVIKGQPLWRGWGL
jgi:hypothetical protein